MRPGSILLIAVVAAALGAGEADDAGQAFIGFRNDGSGVFPADCRPVTEWREMKWSRGEYVDDKGRTQTGMIPTEPDPHHLVWKTPIEMYCNGGMIVAGGRLFALADRGGIGFARGGVPDFLGSRLYCLNPEDGGILWSEDLHHLDKLGGQAESVAEDLKAAVAFHPEAYAAFLEFRKVAGPLLGGGHGMPDYSENTPEGFEEEYAEAAAEFAELWPEVPKTPAEFKADWKKGDKTWTWNYTQLAFKKLMKKAWPEEAERRNRLVEHGYGWCAWYGQGSFVGANMPTPVSDGEHVYVVTGYNDVFCYDLEGQRRWSRWFGPAPDHHGRVLGSPILVGDLLITDLPFKGQETPLRALDKRTGETVWAQKAPGGLSYHHITPVHLALPLPDGGELDVLWTGNGTLLRAQDGEILATKVGCHGNGRHVAFSEERDILVIVNGASDGGRGEPYDLPKGTLALKLEAKGPAEVAHEIIWQLGEDGPSRLVVQGETVYGIKDHRLEARRLADGELLGKSGKLGADAHHLGAIAGGHYFALDFDGSCAVVALGENPSQVAVNRLGERRYRKYDFFNQGSQPFFSGNRIFIRSYTDVYCLGDPKRPMRLSAVHDGDAPLASRRESAGSDAGADAEEASEETAAEPAAEPAIGRAAVVEALTAAVADGDAPRFRMASTGMEVAVTALADGTMTLDADGARLQFPVDRLNDDDVAALARALGLE